MREKEPIAANSDYGKDEDSAEALLKKHDAFMSDLEAYRTVVEGLQDQAQNCNVSYRNLYVCGGGEREAEGMLDNNHQN